MLASAESDLGVAIAIYVALVVIQALACGFGARAIMKGKGRSAGGGFCLGFFLGLIGLLIAGLLPTTPEYEAFKMRRQMELMGMPLPAAPAGSSQFALAGSGAEFQRVRSPGIPSWWRGVVLAFGIVGGAVLAVSGRGALQLAVAVVLAGASVAAALVSKTAPQSAARWGFIAAAVAFAAVFLHYFQGMWISSLAWLFLALAVLVLAGLSAWARSASRDMMPVVHGASRVAGGSPQYQNGTPFGAPNLWSAAPPPPPPPLPPTHFE